MGLGTTNEGGNKTFLSIIGGKIKVPSSEGAPRAEKREWETKDGKSGVKWEITEDFVSGHIVGLNYKDGDYGTVLMIELQDGADFYSLQLSTKSRYYDDFAKKAKAIDLSKEVTLTPFDFEGTNSKGEEKKIVGISVTQDGEKISSYYYDGKKSINKMPAVDEKEKKELGSDYWTIYFTKVRAFLKKEIESIKVPEAREVTDEMKKASNKANVDKLAKVMNGDSEPIGEDDDLPF